MDIQLDFLHPVTFEEPEEFPCDNCEWDINNCCNYPQTDIDCCVLGSKQIKKITD